MEKGKRLMEVSFWERLTVGKIGTCSDGWGMFSKSLIQFSVDRLGYVPSPVIYLGTSPVAQMVKRLPTKRETWV